MNARLKTILKVTGGLICLLLFLWCCLAAYVYSHKAEVLNKITSQLNEEVNGRLLIEDMDPVVMRGFPGIVVSLKNVSLQDTLFYRHGRPLLRAKQVFVALDVLSVIGRQPRIRQLVVKDGTMFVFRDSTGYSNSSLLDRKKEKNKAKVKFNEVLLENMRFVFENQQKLKHFDFTIRELAASISYRLEGGIHTRVVTDMLVHDLSFNRQRGSFLKNGSVSGVLELRYDTREKSLTIPRRTIRINGEDISLQALFRFGEEPSVYSLQLHAPRIRFRDAKRMLTPNIARKLKAVGLERDMDLIARISGRMRFRDTPRVQVGWVVSNNTFHTPAGTVTGCSFRGSFINEAIPGQGHGDRNSLISIYGLVGSWKEIPFVADSVIVSELNRPRVRGSFAADFPTSRLNEALESHSFHFGKGRTKVDIRYNGGIRRSDNVPSAVYGSVRTSGSDISYLPRRLRFPNTNATFSFEGQDLRVSGVRLSQGSSVLLMDGFVPGFLRMFTGDPGATVIAWNVRGNQVDLKDFTGFLAAPGKSKRTNGKKPGSSKLDQAIDRGLVRLKLNLADIKYKTFSAHQVEAMLEMKETGIAIRHAALNHAGGRMSVNGLINRRGASNDFRLNSDIRGVDVKRFFNAFQDFRQKAVTSKDLSGNLFARANITGVIGNGGNIQPYSIRGNVSFDLQHGALNGFEPLSKIKSSLFRGLGKILFGDRDFEHMSFRSVKNTLQFNGDKVIIPPMMIESNAINMLIAGVYGFRKGTDINIDIPLRNPRKDDNIKDAATRQERKMKGIVLHLKAVDGPDGKVQIRLTRKGVRKRDEKDD